MNPAQPFPQLLALLIVLLAGGVQATARRHALWPAAPAAVRRAGPGAADVAERRRLIESAWFVRAFAPSGVLELACGAPPLVSARFTVTAVRNRQPPLTVLDVVHRGEAGQPVWWTHRIDLGTAPREKPLALEFEVRSAAAWRPLLGRPAPPRAAAFAAPLRLPSAISRSADQRANLLLIAEGPATRGPLCRALQEVSADLAARGWLTAAVGLRPAEIQGWPAEIAVVRAPAAGAPEAGEAAVHTLLERWGPRGPWLFCLETTTEGAPRWTAALRARLGAEGLLDQTVIANVRVQGDRLRLACNASVRPAARQLCALVRRACRKARRPADVD